MANPNPYKARLAKALHLKPGDLEATKRRTWGMLCLAYDEVGTAENAEQRRKSMLAYAQIASVYLKLYEIGEIEPRLRAIEQALEQSRASI